MQDITLPDTMTEQKGESVAVDPYGIKEENTAWDIGIYDDNLEVTVLPTESEIKACTALYQRLQYGFPQSFTLISYCISLYINAFTYL